MAPGRVRRTYVAFHDIVTWGNFRPAILAQLLANAVRGIDYNASLSRGKLDVSFALAKET